MKKFMEKLLVVCPQFKGVLVQKIDIFKELTPRSRTYELCSQGKEKKKYYQIQDRQTPHTVLQKLSPKATYTPLKV